MTKDDSEPRSRGTIWKSQLALEDTGAAEEDLEGAKWPMEMARGV